MFECEVGIEVIEFVDCVWWFGVFVFYFEYECVGFVVVFVVELCW